MCIREVRDILFSEGQQTFHLKGKKTKPQQMLANENPHVWLYARELSIFCFLAILANHLEAIFLLTGITVERTEGVATIKPSGKEQKPILDVLMHPKTQNSEKWEKGQLPLYGRLFSQASLEWELT